MNTQEDQEYEDELARKQVQNLMASWTHSVKNQFQECHPEEEETFLNQEIHIFQEKK